jgi:hypothetical protein
MNHRSGAYNAIVAFSIAAWIAACTPAIPTPPAGEVNTVVAVTFSAMTASAPTPTIIPPTATEERPVEVFKPYQVQTITQNVNLRVGPGMLFKVSRVMPQGTTLEVSGRSPAMNGYM